MLGTRRKALHWAVKRMRKMKLKSESKATNPMEGERILATVGVKGNSLAAIEAYLNRQPHGLSDESRLILDHFNEFTNDVQVAWEKELK